MPLIDDPTSSTLNLLTPRGFIPLGRDEETNPTPPPAPLPADKVSFIQQLESFSPYSGGKGIGAALRTDNTIGSAIARLQDTWGVSNDLVEPGYSPWDDVAGTPYEQYWKDTFAYSNNPAYTQALKSSIDRQNADRRTVEAGGGFGMIAGILAGAVDPTILMPVGGAIKLTGKGVWTVGRGALSGAKAGAIGTAAYEAGLHASQDVRTGEETAINISTGIVLGAVVGGTIASALTRTQRVASEAALEKLAGNVTIMPGSAGAAAPHYFTLDDLTINGKITENIAAATAYSPNLRGNFRESPLARRTYQEIATNTLRQQMHEGGLTLGPSVETNINVSLGETIGQALERHPEFYQAGKKANFGMSSDAFDVAIGRAMRRGDVGENEFISNAAKMWRSQVIEPLVKQAEALGLLPEDVKISEAPSYFSRMYNVDKMTAQKPQFMTIATDHFNNVLTEQYTKASQALTTRQADLAEEITNLQLSPEDRLKKLEMIIGQRTALEEAYVSEADIADRIKNLRAVERKARQDGNEAGVADAKAKIESLKQQGGQGFQDFKTEEAKLKKAVRQINLGYGGLQEKADTIQQQLTNLSASNFKSLGRLVARGQKLAKEMKKLDPAKVQQTLSDLRSDFYALVTRSEQAQDRLAKQIEKLRETEKVKPSLKVSKDNPGGDWLERKQAQADKAKAETNDKFGLDARGLRGSTTANTEITLPIDMLKKLEGVNGEKPKAGQPKYDKLKASIEKKGFDQGEGKIMVWVNHKGKAFIYEGNNRVKLAAENGVENLNVEVQWRNGAEEVKGPFSVESLQQTATNNAVDDKLEKALAAERSRTERLNAISERLQATEALDRTADLSELKTAVDEMTLEISNKALGKGERAAVLLERLAKLDPKKVDEHVARLAQLQKDIDYKFREKWEIKRQGEIDTETPDFTRHAKDMAQEVYDSITGNDYGSASIDPQFHLAATTGPLKERTFHIPDEKIEDFLEDNVVKVMSRFARQMSAQVELARKFPDDPLLQNRFNSIKNEYDQLTNAATTDAERAALQKDMKGAFRDLRALLEIHRGSYLAKENASSYGRTVRGTMLFNYIRSMGGAALPSLQDLYNPAIFHGFGRVMNVGVEGLIKAVSKNGLLVKEAKYSGVAERLSHHRLLTLAEIGDPYAGGTAIERLLDTGAHAASKWNGLNMLTDFEKAFDAIIVQDRLNTGLLAGKDTPWIAQSGIGPEMRERIAGYIRKHGTDEDGITVANTDQWDDFEAVRAYRSAINFNVNADVVTRGIGDVPLFAYTPLGKALLQFKTFSLAAHQRTFLRSMQLGPAQFLSGLIGLTTIGMFTTYLKAMRGGAENFERFKKSAENPGYWIGEGLDSTGLFTIPMEISNATEKATLKAGYGVNPIKTPLALAGRAFNPDASVAPNSQRFANQGIITSLAGPTAGLVEDIPVAAGAGIDAAIGEDVSRSQLNAANRIVPYNSYIGMKEFLQYIEGNSPYVESNGFE